MKKFFSININSLIVLTLVIVLIALVLNLKNNKKILNYPLADIQSFKISSEDMINLKIKSNNTEINFSKLLTYYALENNFFNTNTSSNVSKIKLDTDKNFDKKYKILKKKYKNTNYLTYYNFFDKILSEIKTFPIFLEDINSKYYFSDSWGADRTYGGNRAHLGTDIMSQSNISGVVQIVSMTDGIVENLGWNEKGGYRVGIRTKNDNYYYYAHLESFNPSLKIGKKVKSGDFLGYMGDTGYSKIEGTKGKFPVHLHLGIEVKSPFSEEYIWINPYPYLVLIEYINEKNSQ